MIRAAMTAIPPQGRGKRRYFKDDIVTDDDPITRKIVKTYRLELETLDFTKAGTLIVSTAEALGGYVSESSERSTSISGSSGSTRYASYTIRVPADKADEYLEAIEAECNVLRSTLTTEDITDSYYGYKAQLDSLLLQEERLTAMLEKADSLDYLLTLEDKLAQVRAEINSINSKLQLMDKSVNYSYVYITLSEVYKYQPAAQISYWQRVGNAFTGAFETFGNVISTAFLGIVWVLPFLLLGGIIAVIIIAAERSKRKNGKPQYERYGRKEVTPLFPVTVKSKIRKASVLSGFLSAAVPFCQTDCLASP